MRLLILFGSKSDSDVYDELKEKLIHNHEVELAILSAHRQPKELRERLALKNFDALIAGAGLAAHLPGVVASEVDVPVFGVAVSAAFGGLDSVASIQQMPFGVPVMTYHQDRLNDLVDFIDSMECMNDIRKS